jgi:hypothetical protein
MKPTIASTSSCKIKKKIIFAVQLPDVKRRMQIDCLKLKCMTICNWRSWLSVSNMLNSGHEREKKSGFGCYTKVYKMCLTSDNCTAILMLLTSPKHELLIWEEKEGSKLSQNGRERWINRFHIHSSRSFNRTKSLKLNLIGQRSVARWCQILLAVVMRAAESISWYQLTIQLITYYWTGYLILDYSYFVGKLTNSKIVETNALEPLESWNFCISKFRTC